MVVGEKTGVNTPPAENNPNKDTKVGLFGQAMTWIGKQIMINGGNSAMIWAGRRIERFYQTDEVSKANLEEYIDLINQGYSPYKVLAHESYLEGGVASQKNREITNRTNIKGFYFPFARSMADGKQGIMPRLIFNLFKPYYLDSKVIMIPAIRKKEKNLYTPEEIAKSTELTSSTIRQAERNGYGNGFYIPGNMDAGRKRKDNPKLVNGIGKVDTEDTLLHALIAQDISRGKKFAILAIGTSGGYRVVSPDTKWPTSGAFFDLFRKEPHIKVGVFVERPIKSDDIVQMISQIINPNNPTEVLRSTIGKYILHNPKIIYDLVLGTAVQRLREDEQGIYAGASNPPSEA